MPTRSSHIARPHFGLHGHRSRHGRVLVLHPRQARAQGPRSIDVVTDGFKARPLDWIRCLWERLSTARALGLGAEMAFWLFLSLLPLAAAAGMIAAKFAWGNWAAAAPIVQSLPRATQQLLADELGKVAAWNGGKVGIGAGLMFVWLASSGIHSIFDGIEIESEAAPRPWWKKRALALVACVALSVGVAILTLLGTGLGWLWRFVGGSTLFHALVLESSVPLQMVRLLAGAAVSFGLVSGLYWVALPPAARKSMPVVPGALLAIGLNIALGYGYGFYIKKAGDGGAYVAGLASIGVTLIALYLFCLALLIGIEVNQMLGDRRRALLSRGDGHA